MKLAIIGFAYWLVIGLAISLVIGHRIGSDQVWHVWASWAFVGAAGFALTVGIYCLWKLIPRAVRGFRKADRRLLVIWSWAGTVVLMGLFPPTKSGRYGEVAYQFILYGGTSAIHFSQLMIQWTIITTIAGVILATVIMRKHD